MSVDEALEAVNRWFSYLAVQKARSARMQELAVLARTNPKEAQHQMHQLDRQPHVFDGVDLEPAVQELVAEIERLRKENAEFREHLIDCERVLEWGEPKPKPVLQRVRAALAATENR